jgi:HK97 family phage portal protein
MPNLIKRLFRGRTKNLALLTGVNQTFSGFDNAADIQNIGSYKDSLYLYIAVSKISKRAAGIPLELYRIKNKRGDVVEVFDHPILSLLGTPNPFETQRQFLELAFTYYLLSGDCFIYTHRENGRITQLLSLRPDHVQIVLSPDQTTILSYEYNHGTVVRFRPEDILHIRNIDPINPLRGVGVVRPASSRILTEQEATKYQAKFFKNQGRPDMAVFADQVVDEEAGHTFRAKWKSIFGRGEGGQVAVFGSNIKAVQELNKTPKEMDFIETQKFLRDDILAALHVPKAMVTSDDVNLANAKEAYRMYLQEAVVPVFEAFMDILNNRLVPQMDEAVFFAFTDPVPVDRELKLKETTELKKGGIITANEARSMYDYPALEGGDELTNTPSPAVPSEAVKEQAKRFLRARPSLVRKLAAIEEIVNLTLMTQPKRSMSSIFATKALKEGYAKAYNEKADRKADVFKEAIDAFHKGMLERILATDLTPGLFMDVIGEKSLAKATFTPIMVKMYKESGQEALDALFRKADDQFFTNEELLASMEGRAAFFTGSIIDTTYEVLKSKIVDGVANGDGIDKIGRSIRDYFDDMTVKRAKTIARTETGFILSKATNDAYNQSAVVVGKEWINVGDDNVRDDHKDVASGGLNGGVIVAKGEAFPNGEHYPAEHSISCRCVLGPAV